MRLEEGGTLIIEGIHALNPNYTSKIPENEKFKYSSPPPLTKTTTSYHPFPLPTPPSSLFSQPRSQPPTTFYTLPFSFRFLCSLS
eukprot:768563-Hanusia_phi.AAC.6